MKISKIQIYGERCSGTNYLEDLIEKNFDINITWEYGWKHFFGFDQEKLNNSDDTLFICITRDIYNWINSLYREMHHLPLKYIIDINTEDKINRFINCEFYSINDNNQNIDFNDEIMEDRNIYTGNRYKNIFELRHNKLKFLIEDLPKKIKNYILIRYEDLINDFENTMYKIKNTGLIVKNNIIFPLNTTAYKKNVDIEFKLNSKINHISKDLILTNQNFIKMYEIYLGYNIL